MADLTYAQARALIQSDPLTAYAMLISGNRPDGTPIDDGAQSAGAPSSPVALVVNGAASQVLAANTNRMAAEFINTGSVTLWLGTTANVGPANGIPVDVGDDFADYLTGSAWWAITTGADGEIRVMEVNRP